MSKEISRRDFLKRGARAAAAIAGLIIESGNKSSEALAGPAAEKLLEENQPSFKITGVPEKATNVLVAKCQDEYGNCFLNTIGEGSEMMFAEPGVLLVGPDFPQEEIDKSGDHIQRFSPLNQALLDDVDAEGKAGPTARNVPEGAFLWATGAKMRVKVGEVEIQLGEKPGHNWFLVIRGLFKGEGDRNTTAIFSDYFPGHAQTMQYPEGAFISQNALDQTVRVSHTGATNCGADGCSELSVMMLDLNTGAYTVMTQGNNNVWRRVASNW